MTPPPPVALEPAASDRLLPWRKVKDLTGISRTTAWRLQNAGDFPRPVVVSPGRVAWRERDVIAWKETHSPRGALAPPAPARPAAEARAREPRPPATRPPAPVRPPPASRPGQRRSQRPSSQMSFDF